MPSVALRLRLRIPSWLGQGAPGQAPYRLPLQLNGKSYAGPGGVPGSFLAIDREWADGDKLSFVLPTLFRLTRYTGVDQVPVPPNAADSGDKQSALSGRGRLGSVSSTVPE